VNGSGSIAAACVALALRDVRLLVRKPSRVASTILTPVLVWIFFAGGFAPALGGEESYTVALAGGVALLVVTFAAIFGAISMIRDRERGFLRAVLIGPTPRWAVIMSRVGVGAVLAWAQALPVLLAALAMGASPTAAGLAAGLALLACGAIGLSATCTALAWHFDSIEGFHGIMAAVLMPAWLLSGAVFPVEARRGPLGIILEVNPLGHVHRAVIDALGIAETAGIAEPIVVLAFAALACIAAVAGARGDPIRA